MMASLRTHILPIASVGLVLMMDACIRVEARGENQTNPPASTASTCHARNRHVLKCDNPNFGVRAGRTVRYLLGVSDARTMHVLESYPYPGLCGPAIGGGVKCWSSRTRGSKIYRPFSGRRRRQVLFWNEGFCMKSSDLGDRSFYTCQSMDDNKSSSTVVLKNNHTVARFDGGICACGQPDKSRRDRVGGFPEGIATCIFTNIQAYPDRETSQGAELVLDSSLHVLTVLPRDQVGRESFRRSTLCEDIERAPEDAMSIIFSGPPGLAGPDRGSVDEGTGLRMGATKTKGP